MCNFMNENENVSESYLIYNYLNPINLTTFYEFSSNKACCTTLKAYNVLGKEIAVLLK